MNGCELKLVLFFSVEYYAVLVKKRHHGRFPSGTSEEANNHIEKPVLNFLSMDILQTHRSLFYILFFF